ncbi:transportin2-like protein [Novymonas esmeraldas]|uniref:Transportin2-like protein n=1 Tax=Novymonas esmeraldas TaxID=1808958 RepID=A0AAW0F1D4_9TRYP
MYAPTSSDLVTVIELLHNNGVEVSNSRAAYTELKKYESNPSFCVLLSAVFGAAANPVAGMALPVPWVQYRQLAGLTLKNNLASARHELGEHAVREAARFALVSLVDPPDTRIARTSAQVVVKVTALTSLEWWVSSGLGDLSQILLHDLLPSGELRTISALYCLQYLMEDLPKVMGAHSEHIIVRVSQLALSQDASMTIRKAAFRMCFNIYEQASLLDWNVESFSPLQEGLTRASLSFANVCTSLLESSCGEDTVFMILVLRSCSFLLDYFDLFGPLSSTDKQRFSHWWITNSARIVCSQEIAANGKLELVAAAIDLISAAVELFDRNGGETALSVLVAGVPQLISSLVPALARYALLSDEEVANIMDTDNYLIRDTTAVSFEVGGGTKDISEDNMMDDDAAAMTLRSSALKFVDVLSSFSSDATYAALSAPIQHLWGGSNWREREAGIVLVGTIASGCARELSTVLEALAGQILAFISDQNEHVCVVSIAAWSLSRLAESILNTSPRMMDSVLPLLGSRLQSTSKRIQISSVSALNTIYGVLESYSCTAAILPHLPTLLESVSTCLPVYSTTNLSLLVDLLSKLIPLLRDKAAAEELFSLLQRERAIRASSFERTYEAMYIREEPNVLLDKDIFSLDRAIIAFVATYPDSDVAVASLSTWSNVLADIRSRNITDDADLVFNTLLICSAYTSSVSTDVLGGWLRSTSWALPTTAGHLLAASRRQEVKMAAITILCALLRPLGSSALPTGLHDFLLQWAAREVGEVEDPQLKEYIVRLISQATSHYPGQLSAEATTALTAANAALRSDVFGDSAHYFATMAFDLCDVLGALPNYAACFRTDIMSQLMAQSENSLAKSEATIQLCQAAVRLPADAFSNIFPFAVKVVYSWQQASPNYPGTKEAIQSFLFHAAGTCPSVFQSTLQGLPAAFRGMLVSLYQLQ